MADTDWRDALTNEDKDAFRKAVDPHTDTLLAAARRDLFYYRRKGKIGEQDLVPADVVGEAIVQAWDRRDRLPEQMSLRGWLLAVTHRAARGLVARQHALDTDKIASLHAPVPTEGDPSDSAQQWFYEWYQPDSVVTWEEITPGAVPTDLSEPVDGSQLDELEDETARGALLLHQEFDMPADEVAFAVGISLNELAERIQGARVTLRERMNAEGVDVEGTALPYGAPDQAG
jgi:DNA-directed RNA polymerase specialized sigma24 family protein